MSLCLFRLVVWVVLLILRFTMLKGVRMILPFLADFRMVVEILLELRMLRQISRVVNQLGVFCQLLGHVRMIVQKRIGPA